MKYDILLNIYLVRLIWHSYCKSEVPAPFLEGSDSGSLGCDPGKSIFDKHSQMILIKTLFEGPDSGSLECDPGQSIFDKHSQNAKAFVSSTSKCLRTGTKMLILEPYLQSF